LKTPADNPLLLDKANLDNPGADPAVWEKVVRKLGVGSMPPQGSPRPDAQETARLRTWLATSLDAAAERNDNAGRVALHRLNRTEYANAVRDLFGVTVDISNLLPPDSSEFGFDNIASVLKVSPALLEQYVTAGVRVASVAVGDPNMESEAHT